MNLTLPLRNEQGYGEELPFTICLTMLCILTLLTSCGREIGPLESAWNFEHVIIDGQPLATYRINDIQIGDIDGDGLPDIWSSGRGAGEGVYQMVWYRNPTWTRHEIALGDFKYGVLADLDGDGDLDVVVGRYWFENTGTPSDRDWPRHSLGHSLEPDLVLIGDIEGDSRLDVIFTTKRELYWLPGPEDPRGHWTSYRIHADSNNRTGGTLADIDSDGDLDIVWGNAWFENPSDPTVVPWPMHMIDAAWPAEARVAVADFDGDGRPDIVLSDEEGDQGIAWYKAPPDPKTGQWQKYQITSTYSGVHSLQIADFNRDGKLDIFAAEMHTKGEHRVTVFESVEIESNTWAEHILARSGSHNAKVGDLDGDGYPDIVGKNFEGSAVAPLRVDVWLNQLGRRPLRVDRWRRHILDDSRPWQAVFIEAGDINGDRLPDIITGGWWYQNPGHPGGAWIRHVIGGELYNMAVVYDFDGDGDLDILGTTGKMRSDEFVWAENNGRGSFTLHTNIPKADGDFLQGARAARILPEGHVQVVLSWHNATSTQMLRVPSPATAPWMWGMLSPTTNAEQIAISDIDGDGALDIHLGTVWLRHDARTWTTVDAVTLSTPKASPDRVELADLDGDGDLDVVIGCEHAKCVVWGENPGNAHDPWTEHVISTDILGMSLDVADIDGDGDIDIVVGEHNTKNPSMGKVVIYENLDRGRSWKVHVIDTGLEHHVGTRFIDIDNDRDLDIISIGWTHGKVVLYENIAIDDGAATSALGKKLIIHP